MTEQDMNEARTNPEFLQFLDKQQEKALEEENISELYQVLDTLLVLDLDEQRVHKVYQEILKIAFENIEERLEGNSKLGLDGDDLFFIRSFYEHAIEKWSVENYDGAKELFFILTQIIADESLEKAMAIHMCESAKKSDIDSFYGDADLDANKDERYGYFITEFSYDKDQYLEDNGKLIEQLYNQLQHLVNG